MLVNLMSSCDTLGINSLYVNKVLVHQDLTNNLQTNLETKQSLIILQRQLPSKAGPSTNIFTILTHTIHHLQEAPQIWSPSSIPSQLQLFEKALEQRLPLDEKPPPLKATLQYSLASILAGSANKDHSAVTSPFFRVSWQSGEFFVFHSLCE